MNTQFFNHKTFTLEYITFGSGSEILICFHGFGRTNKDFLFFQSTLSEKYTVYAFNFFHHGNSVYPEQRVDDDTLTKKELAELFEQFTKEKQIDRFSLMGYSMGGKIALSLLEHFPKRISELFLLAPDGIVTNFWYKFSSKNKIGNALYRRILRKPNSFLRFLKFLRQTRLLSNKMYHFVLHNLDSDAKRQLVYKVWMTLRHIEPNPAYCAQLIRENNIETHLFYGEFDNVIVPKVGRKFANLIQQTENFHLIKSGHNLFKEETHEVMDKLMQE